MICRVGLDRHQIHADHCEVVTVNAEDEGSIGGPIDKSEYVFFALSII